MRQEWCFQSCLRARLHVEGFYLVVSSFLNKHTEEEITDIVPFPQRPHLKGPPVFMLFEGRI